MNYASILPKDVRVYNKAQFSYLPFLPAVVIEKTSPPVPVEVAPEASTSSASQVIAPTQVTGQWGICCIVHPMKTHVWTALKCNIKCVRLITTRLVRTANVLEKSVHK